MNGTPHAHHVSIYTYGHGWNIIYGDQQRDVRKPRFRNPEKVLKAAVRGMIARHDRASLKAEDDNRKAEARAQRRRSTREALEVTAAKVLMTMNPVEQERWGSEQLGN